MTIIRPKASFVTGDGDSVIGSAVDALAGGALDLPSVGVHQLAVELGTGRAHDRVEMIVSHLSPLADIAGGTRLQVGLGAGEEPADVLAVNVMALTDSPNGRRIVGFAPSRALDDLHLSRSYVQQSVSAIVEDVLGETDVDAGSIDGSRMLAHYHIDGRRTAWHNLHRLAGLFGFEITSEPDGALSFKPAPGVEAGGLGGAVGAATGAAVGALGLGTGNGLRRGANVLSWRVGDLRPLPSPVPEVSALGAASPFGAPRGHHLLKAPEGGSTLTLVNPSLRDTDSASAASQALSAAASRRRRGGRFSVVGDPTLRAGTDVSVDDDTWHVRSVLHRIDSHTGYTCELQVESVS